jgi:tetratricopeptide (TPR) repeat protein
MLPPFLKERGVLGRGGQKRVLLVEDARTGETLAAAEVAADAVAREQIHDTMQRLQAGRAACVAPIREVVESGDTCWLLSEHFPGGDLGHYLARRGEPLPARDALEIASRVARALAYAHAQGAVHGDVKPSNILIDASGETYLSDFSLRVPSALRDGRPTGTLAYMAPEVLHGAPPSPASDVYALGCLLFELLTGATPFQGDDPDDVLRRHHLDEPARISARIAEAPPLLDALLQRLLDKRPELRPACSADVTHTLEALCVGVGSSRRARGALVAREAISSRVVRVLDEVAAGAGAAIHLEGIAGIGKSRLLEDLLERAEARAYRVLRASGHEGHRRPHGVLADLVRPMAAWLDELEPDDAATLRGLLGPSGRESTRDVLDMEPMGAVTRALAGALRRWSASRPLAVAIDDIQWADGDSLDALAAIEDSLARGVARMPGLLLVRAERCAPAPRDEEVQGDLPCRHRICLAPLGESEIYELLVARGFARPTDHLVRYVARTSDGVPLLADLLLDELGRAGHLGSRAGETALTGVPELGERASLLADTVRRVVLELSADARAQLEWAACFGPTFLERDVDEASGKSGAASEHAGALRAAGLVEPFGLGRRFRHPLLWREVYQAIDPMRREELHRRIADWAAGRPDGEPREQPARVVHHLLRAGSLAAPEELATWIRAAGEMAYRLFAWREAADLFEDAIARCQGRADFSPELVAELHRRAGLSHYFCFEAKLSVEHLDRAVDAFRGTGDELGYTRALHDLVRAVGQRGGVAYGTMGQRVAELREALVNLGTREPELRARILASLAEANWNAQRPSEADGYARQALELASQVGDHRLCGECHIQIAISAMQRMDLSLTLSHLRQAEAHGKRVGEAYVTRLALGRLPIVLFTLGRIDEAREVLGRAIATREVVQSQGDAALERSLATLFAAAAGDVEGAEREGAELLQMVQRIGFPWPRLVLHPSLAYARVLKRDFAGAIASLRELVEPGVVFEDPSSLRDANRRWVALIHYYAGDALALRADDLGEAELPAPDAPLDIAHLVQLGLYVELCDAAGLPVHPRADAALARAQSHGAILAVSWPFLLPRSRGLAALGRGRADEAVAHLREALVCAQRLDSPVELARSRYELARALALTGTRLAWLEARRELEQALPVLARLGPVAHGERAGRLMEFLDDRIG